VNGSPLFDALILFRRQIFIVTINLSDDDLT